MPDVPVKPGTVPGAPSLNPSGSTPIFYKPGTVPGFDLSEGPSAGEISLA